MQAAYQQPSGTNSTRSYFIFITDYRVKKIDTKNNIKSKFVSLYVVKMCHLQHLYNITTQ